MTAPSSSPDVPANVASASSASVARPYSSTEIDVSCTSPLMLLFASAGIWLVIGLLLNFIASIKLHSPGFFADASWMTYGRIRPAGMNALLYGFASEVAIGIIIWLTCRLGAVTLCCQTPVLLAVAFWNLGVTFGVLGILGGGSTGFMWLEMPRFAGVILFGSYAIIGVCVLVTFLNRTERRIYVSLWYVLAALFLFPWVFSAANLLLLYWPVRGVFQAFINTWFTNNFLTLWLGSVALATLFYFIPKLANRPLYSIYVAGVGFGTYLVVAGWTGSLQLIGGPLPTWMIAIGSSAAIVLILPTIAVGLNWYKTVVPAKAPTPGRSSLEIGPQLRQIPALFRGDIVLRFISFGAFAFFVATICNILLGCYVVASITQFSFVPTAVLYLSLFGFFGMTAFGAMYYIIPRATQMVWPSEKLVRVHFGCSAAGIVILFLTFLLGGLIQGYRLNQTTVDVAQVTRGAIPFIGFGTLGFLVLLVGQIAFLKSFFTLLHRQAAPVRQAAAGLFFPGPARAGGKP
jgi:cytochrome c oxidase cbb3-type subunit I